MSGPWTVRDTVIVTDGDVHTDEVSPLVRSSNAVGGVRQSMVSWCDCSGRYFPLCRYDLPSALKRSTNVSEFASSAEVTAHAARALRPIGTKGSAGTVTPRTSKPPPCSSTSQKKDGFAKLVCGSD